MRRKTAVPLSSDATLLPLREPESALREQELNLEPDLPISTKGRSFYVVVVLQIDINGLGTDFE
ncbi:MAG: hypothetical protein ACI8X5_003977, partial [Planctomycetota bacterium]